MTLVILYASSLQSASFFIATSVDAKCEFRLLGLRMLRAVS